MSTIVIDKDILNDHVVDCVLDVQSIEVSGHDFSFSWNKTSKAKSVSIDFQFDDDLIIERYDYVHKDDVAELIERLRVQAEQTKKYIELYTQQQELVQYSTEELSRVNGLVNSLRTKLSIAEVTLQKECENNSWWRFWK